MNGKQLKNSILQLAIQGKLVPQNSNDEPASELLKRIRKEKEALVKAKKIKKEKPLPEITDDEKPFEIPESWEWCRLGEICSIKGGKRIPVGYSFSDIPTDHIYIRVSDMKNGTISLNDLHYITDEVYDKIKQYIITKDDLYMTIVGATIGKCGVVPESLNNQNLTENAARIIPYLLDKLFLLQCLNTDFCQSQFIDKTNQVGVQKMALSRFSATLIPLPPLAEQKRIVEKIEELMPIVDEYDKAQTELDKLNAELPERLKKSVLQEAIQGRLGTNNPADEPASELLKRIRKEKEALVKAKKIKKEKPIPEITDEEKPFEIPENWEWCRLKECSSVLYGFPFDSQLFNEYGQGMPMIRIRDVVPGTTKLYTTEIADERYIIKKGDMLVGMDGNFNVAFWKSDNAYLNQRVCKITARETCLLQKFLFYYLPFVLEDICKDAHYVTVKHLSDKHLTSVIVPLPPLAEQKRIVEKLDAILPQIENIK